MIANVNGRICGGEDAVVSVFDHGFVFGEGVYETLRTYDRRPFLLERHLQRLRASAAMIDLALPLDDAEIGRRIGETIEAVDGGSEVYLRILITPGPGEFTYDPASRGDPTVVIIARRFAPPPPDLYAVGVTISVVSISRSQPSSISPLIKSNNLLPNAMAMREAMRRGAYEGLMLNYRGEITECTQSNFFIVKQGVVLTPPLESGLLAGITRELIIECARETGVALTETVIGMHDLLIADEAFLSSTTRELVPVVRVDRHVLGSGQPGPVTTRLLSAFRERAIRLSR